MNTAPAIHAGAVLVGETGILVRGPSGSGKSSLVLALMTLRPATAWLVADDRVILAAAHGRLVAAAPPAIAGLIEVRGQGILHRPHVSPVVIRVVVDLAPAGTVERLPEPSTAVADILGVTLPRLALPPGIADGAARVLARVAALTQEMADYKDSKASCVAESIGQDTAFGAAGGAGRDGRRDAVAGRRGIGRRSGT